jgi:hypothetical protein
VNNPNEGQIWANFPIDRQFSLQPEYIYDVGFDHLLDGIGFTWGVSSCGSLRRTCSMPRRTKSRVSTSRSNRFRQVRRTR